MARKKTTACPDSFYRMVILFSRKVIGWTLVDHIREELILGTLQIAVSCRKEFGDK
jgi:hypothetical protein